MARRSSSSRSSNNSRAAPTQSRQTPVQQKAAPPATVQQPSAGGGFLSGVAQIATGSVIGHGISESYLNHFIFIRLLMAFIDSLARKI